MYWKKIQDFKVHCLLLSYFEGSQHVHRLWADDMELFHGCGKGERFGEAITRFRASCSTMKLARSARGGILIHTISMMRHVEVQEFRTFEEEETCVEHCRLLYECLYHRDDNFDADYGDMSVEHKLEIMESFVRFVRFVKKASNPFAAVAKRNKKEKIDQPSAKDDPKIIWKHVLPAYSVPLEDSGASMATNSRSMGRARHQARMHFL